MNIFEKATEEDDLINRLGAILLLPSKSNRKRNISTAVSPEQENSLISSFSIAKPCLAKEHSPFPKELVTQQKAHHSPISKGNSSFNTTTFGRGSKITPNFSFANPTLEECNPDAFLKKKAFSKERVSSKLMFPSEESSKSQINPSDVFVKDEITGFYLEKKNKKLVDEWLDDLSVKSSPSASIAKPKRKTRKSLRKKQLLYEQNTTVMPNKSNLPESCVTPESVPPVSSRNISTKSRGRTWKANYLAKRNLISKLVVPPRLSSLPQTTERKSTVAPTVSFEVTETSQIRDVPKNLNISKSLQKSETLDNTSPVQLQQLNALLTSPFSIQPTKTNVINTSLSPSSPQEGPPDFTTTTTRVGLPHFRSLLRKRRPLKSRRRSTRKVSIRVI